MGKDISNNTLAVLVLTGVLISVIGLFISTSYQNKVSGFVTSNISNTTATTSASVQATLRLNVTDQNISLGDVFVGETNDSEVVDDFFQTQNDGSVPFNLSVYGNANTDSPFISTTANCTQPIPVNGTCSPDRLPNTFYQIHANETQSGTANKTYGAVQPGFVNKTLLVANLGVSDTADNASIGVRITVPTDETAGAKSATVILYATQASS